MCGEKMGNFIARNSDFLNDGNPAGWTYSEVIADGEIGDVVRVKPSRKGTYNISCTLIAGANIGKFQVTTSSDASVADDTAIWQDWVKGDVSGVVTDVIVGPITGIRGVSVSGEVKIEIVI